MLMSAEAACKDAVKQARGGLKDNVRPPQALRELASIREKDAEEGCHRIFLRYDLAVPIKIHRLKLGSGGELKEFPCIPFSSWVRFLLDNNRLDKLCGVGSDAMEARLTEFWRRYKELFPGHELFRLAAAGQVNLSRSIPVFSHTDEGRTYGSRALLLISVHGALGRGTASYVRRTSVLGIPRLTEEGMGMNYLGCTWGTQFLYASLLRSVSNAHPLVLEQLLRHFSQDMNVLARTGICSSSGKEDSRIWIQHLGTKGDLPALSKLGSFKRAYNHVPARNHKPSTTGICFLCLAGRELPEHIPFEDFSAAASWPATRFCERPWDGENLPAIMGNIPWITACPESFFATDMWHNYHNGVGKIWTANAIVMFYSAGFLTGRNFGERFDFLNQQYRLFFSRNKITPLIKQLTRDTFSFDSLESSPLGVWSKAAATTQMMLFLDSFCQDFVAGRTDDPILKAIDPWRSFSWQTFVGTGPWVAGVCKSLG